MTDWTTLAAGLADELVRLGKVRSPEWQAAVRAVPRHELVPVQHLYDPSTGTWTPRSTADDLALVYSNTALFVLPGGRSWTSMPGLMPRMLETLDVRDGHDVLEVGTGTGYNAALLSHRIGDQHVFSVDIEPDLVQLARERLARIGYRPTLVTADGADGLPEHAPYDRIVGTCSVPSVPWAWVEQVREGGLILVDLKLAPLAGNLVLLHRDGQRVDGRFDPTYASFMAMRHVRDEPRTRRPPRDHGMANERTTTLDLPRPWEHGVVWFLAHHALPHGTEFSLSGDGPGEPPRHTVLTSPDGSWCEVHAEAEDGRRRVHETGAHRLWGTIEEAHRQWLALGQPGWDRFGLSVTREHQWTWLDEPGRPLHART